MENKMNSLSNFKQFIEGWDLHIESLDDFDEAVKMQNVIQETINFLLAQTVEWEEKSLEKDPTGEGLLNLHENTKYKDFNRIANNLMWLKSRVKDLFEIKHRRTKENFDLRAQIAEVKLKIKNI